MKKGVKIAIISAFAVLGAAGTLLVIHVRKPEPRPLAGKPPVHQSAERRVPDFASSNKASDFVIKGLSSDSDAAAVRAKMGEPIEKNRVAEQSVHNPDYLAYWETWKYPGIEITFLNNGARNEDAPTDPGMLFVVVVTRSDVPTGRGIRVGDSVDRVVEKYGPARTESGVYYYEAGLQYVAFTVVTGRVTRIEVGSLLD